MLSKNELAERIAETGAGGKQQVKHILDALADVVEDEVMAGNNVTVPGVAAIKFRYSAPAKKGERWKKGEERVKFGGVTEIAESDSPAKKQSIKLKAEPAPALKRHGKDTKVMNKAIAKAKK